MLAGLLTNIPWSARVSRRVKALLKQDEALLNAIIQMFKQGVI